MTTDPRQVSTTHDIQLLDADECASTREQIHSLRRYWTQRHPALPFYTLGAASYLDASYMGFPAYQQAARRTNPVLDEHFGWLHQRLAETLTDTFGPDFVYDHELALPGFHVFLYHQGFDQSLPSVHFDLQYRSIDWSKYQGVEFSGVLSMTLSIALPVNGAGLRVWDVLPRDIDKMSPAEQKEMQNPTDEPRLHPYAEGKLVYHSGHQLHQIAILDVVEDDERTTLQAHAMPVDGGKRYVVYW